MPSFSKAIRENVREVWKPNGLDAIASALNCSGDEVRVSFEHLFDLDCIDFRDNGGPRLYALPEAFRNSADERRERLARRAVPTIDLPDDELAAGYFGGAPAGPGGAGGAPSGLGRSSFTDCAPFSTTIERKSIPRTRQPSFSSPTRSREIASGVDP